MKSLVNLVFETYIKLFKIPCKMHIKYALYKKQYSPGDMLWRVSMLYACGVDIKDISELRNISEEEIKDMLNKFTRGVVYE
jgi:hypothetical protein